MAALLGQVQQAFSMRPEGLLASRPLPRQYELSRRLAARRPGRAPMLRAGRPWSLYIARERPHERRARGKARAWVSESENAVARFGRHKCL